MFGTWRFSAARTAVLLGALAGTVLGSSEEASSIPALTASWVDNSDGIATTRIERRVATETSFTAIADVPPGVTTYVDGSVSPETTYCYRAMAYTETAASPYSEEVCATTVADTETITVTKAGTGAGTVASAPAGINCGSTCSATYAAGTAVTLTATPASGSTFSGWGGSCSGKDTCTVAGNGSFSVTATFTASTETITVTKTGTGAGTVASTPAGINCGSTCSAIYTAGASVTLTATAASGSTFSGWSGSCSGTGICTVAGTGTFAVTATFTAATATTITVTKAGNGRGAVTSTPDGIKCGITCSATYPAATSITLKAQAATGSIFSGWSGSCSGTRSCTIADAGAHAVTATFTADPSTSFALTVTRTGPGKVTSSPVGISCGKDCSQGYPGGTAVTLTATPASGAVFVGWRGGGCSGSVPTCVVMVNSAVSVSAKFKRVSQ